MSDIETAVAFYEGKLGLQPLEPGPSAHIAGGSRVHGSGGGPALNVAGGGRVAWFQDPDGNTFALEADV